MRYLTIIISFLFIGCASDKAPLHQIDVLIEGGTLVDGTGSDPQLGSVGIVGNRIVLVGSAEGLIANRTIDATGLVVSPGFIDPHTHAEEQLLIESSSINEAYLRQGVSTVFIGNDGGEGLVPALRQTLEKHGIGTNVGLWAGHGTIRREIVGEDNRSPSEQEMADMKALLAKDMEAGALGLSTGLFYAPGSYANVDEIVELAKVAAKFGGIYESHIRDESDYNIGLIAAVQELLDISTRAEIQAHVAHIKALGPSVHGQSKQLVELINAARERGLVITADQYPWLASGTRISNALIPRALMDGGVTKMEARLRDEKLITEIRPQMQANLKRRGGADAILITGESPYRGKTLQQHADETNTDILDMAIEIVLAGDPAIASFMMDQNDVDHLLVQPWVVTGSDGDDGHPRKYGSFPKKFTDYTRDRKLLSLSEFVRQSSGKTAEIFGLCKRGLIAEGYKADISLWDPQLYQSRASYENPARFATGVKYLLINGEMVIDDTKLTGDKAGQVVGRFECD